MAWRLAAWVIEGEIDNTAMGWTNGWIRLRNREAPLMLKLAGNCRPDLAGWKFRILPDASHPKYNAIFDDQVGPFPENINSDQSGTVGEITEQMIKEFDCSVGEFHRRSKLGQPPPITLRKAIYLEWFSNFNGRMVIQSTHLKAERTGTRAFELTEGSSSLNVIAWKWITSCFSLEKPCPNVQLMISMTSTEINRINRLKRSSIDDQRDYLWQSRQLLPLRYFNRFPFPMYRMPIAFRLQCERCSTQ